MTITQCMPSFHALKINKLQKIDDTTLLSYD